LEIEKGDENMIDVYEYTKENNLVKFSAIPHLDAVKDFFKNLKINVAVDIGTYKGIGAAYIAQFANKVYTFDIIERPVIHKVWDDLEVRDKICFYLIKGRDDNPSKDKRAIDIETILDTIKFDFAFIDDGHSENDVEEDFKLVKRCGRVLFHDANKIYYPHIYKFMRKIGAKQLHDWLGYWEAK